MKKMNFLFLLSFLFSLSLTAQTKPGWPEMKEFHGVMSATFHPAEEGNLQPLKEKAETLYEVSKKWMNSSIPSNFKVEETQSALKKLNQKCQDIMVSLKEKANDEQLKTMITEAHDIFHNIVGECRKAEQ